MSRPAKVTRGWRFEEGVLFRPVLKWAGGKALLVPAIARHFPERIGTYFEPFCGAAAVFFALAAERRFERAVLSDQNEELIDVYRALKSGAKGVVSVLEQHKAAHSEESYYRVRAIDPKTLDRPARAARTIYLNKTGYNGLYRVNSKGLFNVPYGRYANPGICDRDTLEAASTALRGVELRVTDFESAVADAAPGDVVYFDPPYLPLSTTSFTKYHRLDFGMDDQKRLARVFGELARRKVLAVLSNSDTPETRALYARFAIHDVQVRRNINSRVAGRGHIGEIIVVNRKR